MKKTKKVMNKVFAFCMVMVVCLTCSLNGMTVKAAEQKDVFSQTYGTFSSTGDVYTFTTTEVKDFLVEVDVIDPNVNVDIKFIAVATGETRDAVITSADWKLDNANSLYWYSFGIKSLPVGDYQVKISSTNTGNYMAFGWLESSISLNATSVSLKAGQKKTLAVEGTTEVVQWTSSNTAVATVDSEGVVTAKKAGEATITATVAGETLTCNIVVRKPVISNKTYVITAGQKKTLKVTGNAGKVTWKTSKKSVATVSNKGVVTAKKAGKAKITASVDGCKLTCTVTVKKNEYRFAVASNSEAGYGVWLNTTKVSYDKKGQLVCKVQIINNSINKIEQLKNLSMTVYNEKGAVVGKHKISKMNVVIYSGNSKTITITIPKSKVKKKNADLRLAQHPVCSGDYVYNTRF